MWKHPNWPFLAPNSETGGNTNSKFNTNLPFVSRNIMLKFYNDPSIRTTVRQRKRNVHAQTMTPTTPYHNTTSIFFLRSYNKKNDAYYFSGCNWKQFFRPKISDVSTFTFDLPIKWTRVATFFFLLLFVLSTIRLVHLYIVIVTDTG